MWTFRFNELPKRWMTVIAPHWPSRSPSLAARRRAQPNTTRMKTASTSRHSAASKASWCRSDHSSDSTHCRTGTSGITRSTSCAASSIIRRSPHEGAEPAFATERHYQKDIVHSSDTVNTAARVEAQCRPLERRVLVSEALVSQCQVPEELEEMGERELRGKVEALRLYCARSRI